MERQDVLQRFRDVEDPRGKNMKGKVLDMLQYETIDMDGKITGNNIEQEKAYEVRPPRYSTQPLAAYMTRSRCTRRKLV
jgi:hypothetical protein